MKTKLLSVLLCVYIFYSCDPDDKRTVEPEQPPIEHPNKPDTPNQQDTLDIPDKPDIPDVPEKPKEYIDIKFTDKITKINNEYMVVGNNDWTEVVFENNISIVIGNNTSNWRGYYTVSTDGGKTWEIATQLHTSSLNYLTFGNGNFIVTSGNQYFTSSDGNSWNSAYFPIVGSNRLSPYSMIFANNMFVMGCSKGFATSTDGKTWTYHAVSGNGQSWSALGYGNGKYFVADYSGGYFTSSSDGITWTSSSQKFTKNKNYKHAVYGNGIYLISDKYGYAYISTDLVTWTQKNIPSFNDIIFHNGKFIGIKENNIYTSEDGITYTSEKMKDEEGNVVSISANSICAI